MRNPKAKVIDANSLVTVTLPRVIKNKKVLVIEDGPSLTHGELSFGAGVVAAKKYKCRLADPKKYVSGELKKTFKEFNIKNLIPAMGYSPKQIKELQSAVNKTPCDAVIIATPINLAQLIKIKKPFVRVTYELDPKNKAALIKLIKHSVKK
jgi:predicted GTPase